MLTEEELLVRARDWADILYPIIPAQHLEACCRKAFANHTSTFPINAYDLKLAYDAIKNSAVLVESSRTLTTDERVSQCTNRAAHIPDTFGEVYLFIPSVTDEEVIVPCGLCRKEDYQAAKAEILAGLKEPTFEEKIAAVKP